MGLLKFINLFQSFAFYKFAHCSTISDFHEIGFEVIVSKAEVEILFGVVLDGLELTLDKLFLHDFQVLHGEEAVYHQISIFFNIVFVIFFLQAQCVLPLLLIYDHSNKFIFD
jgi:hypothetical protein